MGLVSNQAARGQDNAPKDRKIKVTNRGNVVITATLFQDGKAVRTQDTGTEGFWLAENLARGNYEVRLEAPQCMVVVKKVALFDEDTILQAELPKGTGTVVFGGGPSVQELEARIKKLEEKSQPK
jgi:hypothetical protein